MKKPIHLYIFVVLSGLASALRLFSALVPTFDEAKTRSMYESSGFPNVEEMIQILRASSAFSTNVINKSFAIVLLLLLVATIVFLFQKKNEQASYIYLGYLFVALLANTYGYIGGKGLAMIYSDELMRQSTQTTLFWSYIVNIVIFAIYFGVTIFFHLRKPKEKPSTAVNSTDI